MPDGFQSRFVLNHPGVDQFRDAFGLPRRHLGVDAYRFGFRAWLAAMWLAYLALMIAGLTGGALPSRRSVGVVLVAVALVTGVFWPPALSCDVYGYVGYGRMQVLYGLDPYVTPQGKLVTLGDATGRFLLWNIPSPYGPLWTSLSIGVVWLLRGAGLFVQIVSMKLIGAAALVGLAWGGSRVTERLAPGRGTLTLVGIGFNPLFIIEAPGNAHNDFVMMALVVAAFGAALDGRTGRAVLWAGVAGAVKFLPLLLVPWILAQRWASRDRSLPWRRGARAVAAYGLAATLPIAIAYGPYWRGAETLAGVVLRWRSGQASAVGSGAPGAEAALFALVYAGATVWVARGARARLLTAWTGVTAAVAFATVGIWLPWYLSWVWAPALMSWDKRSATISYVAFCFAVVLTLGYATPLPG